MKSCLLQSANNGVVLGNLKKEASVGRSLSYYQSLVQDKSSQTGTDSVGMSRLSAE
jgi:hypothetical protein